MKLKEEERRWESVIEQYNAEIGKSMIEFNTLIGKGYATKGNNDSIAITERGIGFVEANLQSAGINEKAIGEDQTTKDIISLLSKSDVELDILACKSIYIHKHGNPPSEESLQILRRMLETAAIPKSE